MNNYTDADVDRIRGLTERDGISYYICAREVGESGTRHLQGFVQFIRKKSMGGVKACLGSDRLHLEIRRGTPSEAREYCTKEGDFFEYGEMDTRRGQGSRSDLVEIQKRLSTGSPMLDIADNYFGDFCRYWRSFQKYRELLSTPRDFRTQVVWLWGPTGTGKSRLAFSEAHNLSRGSVCSLADTSLVWFDPYAGEKAVILDDFTGSAAICILLRIFDRYPLRVPIKGGFVEWRPRICWITSNFHPRELYRNERQIDALLRRIDEIKEIL